MEFDSKDTIVAVSTPPGENGIGIVRISGQQALKITDEIFKASSNKRASAAKSHTIHYGHIVNNGF